MAPALLLRVVLAGASVWAAPAVLVCEPVLGAAASRAAEERTGAIPATDGTIATDWATLPARTARRRGKRAPSQCDVVKRPKAVPRASVDTLTDDDFARLPFSGQLDTRFQSLFSKLHSGRDVKIVVLGGSFTEGTGCEEPAAGRNITLNACAWPARAQRGLSELFPQSSIALMNMAVGGSETKVILGAVGLLLPGVPGGPGEIDLIMIDTLLNDSSERFNNLESDVRASYEALVRVLHEVAPQAVVVPVIDGCDNCMSFAPAHRAVASFYGLPLVDYADLVARTANPDLWCCDFHPGWRSHQILADVVVGTLAAGFRGLCAASAGVPKPTFPAGTLAPQEFLDRFETCRVGESEYYAPKQDGPQPTIVRGWRLFEDRPGKPGWISERPDAVLTFRLSFGAMPTLLFTFLRTYEHIGHAVLEMNGRRVVVQGLGTERTSVSRTLWYNARRPGEFDVAPDSKDVVLRVTAPRGKFKIISVVSC